MWDGWEAEDQAGRGALSYSGDELTLLSRRLKVI